MRLRRRRIVALALVLALCGAGAGAIVFLSVSRAQQVGDTTFVAHVAHPAFAPGKGPLVLLDEAHHNFHRLDGRYRPFGLVLMADGCVIRPSREPLSLAALGDARLLVIANAIDATNDTNWTQPIASAFTKPEIEALKEWIKRGGALLLIADHMPFAGAATALGAAFDVRFSDGFAMVPGVKGPLVFRRGDGLTVDALGVSIDSVATFTGSAFEPPKGASVILRLPKDAYSIEPKVAWEFDGQPKRGVGGWAQGAVFRYGKGRVAVFGEAAMFTSQQTANGFTGLRSREAPQNEAFLLALIHWLTDYRSASK